MRHHTGGRQLFDHIPPPGATLQRELAITIRAVLAQPAPQRLARGRTNLTPVHQAVVIHVIKRDLLSVHVKAAYHGHRDLLELLKHFLDAISTSVWAEGVLITCHLSLDGLLGGQDGDFGEVDVARY